MTTEFKNIELIFDLDNGEENEGWYSRHSEYIDGEFDHQMDTILDSDTESEAIEDVCRHLGCSADDITVIDNR